MTAADDPPAATSGAGPATALEAAFAELDEAQRNGLGDMDPERFRAAAHAAVDLMADYLAGVERYPVLPPVAPGELRARFPAEPPSGPEPLGQILGDYLRLVEPNVTHWQHPGFFAYFSTNASGPGILGEMFMATLVANAMLWRTSPVATELEEVTVGWLRRMLGLSDAFDGLFTDTASTSSLIGLAAARQAVEGRRIAQEGLAGAGRLRVYCSSEAHSSIEKAAMTLGIGRAGVRRIEVDEEYRMRSELLTTAIAEDRAGGWVPAGVVATLGTTSTTSVDPAAALAEIAERERLWLHVDAAYAGAAALLPEMRSLFAGWERADSIVVNPHKWFFAPLDCSLLLTRRPEVVRDAFSLVPEYLRTLGEAAPVHDFNEYTPQLGRRFRALKMWMLIRYFGVDGLARRVREHIRLAGLFASWIDADPEMERLAPVPFSTVCFRHVPAALAGRRDGPGIADQLDRHNEALLDAVNRDGRLFLSHTRLRDRFALRLAVGSLRHDEARVAEAWRVIREIASRPEAGRRD